LTATFTSGSIVPTSRTAKVRVSRWTIANLAGVVVFVFRHHQKPKLAATTSKTIASHFRFCTHRLTEITPEL
jgi:hypothetical protein